MTSLELIEGLTFSCLFTIASFNRLMALFFFYLMRTSSLFAYFTVTETLLSTIALIVELSMLRSLSKPFCVFLLSWLTFLFVKLAAIAATPSSLFSSFL